MKPRFCERLVIVALFLSVVLVSSRASAVDVCYQLPFSNPNLADGWGSLCCGRTTPHRGVDFAQPTGTKVPSVADGVVVKVTSTSCLGNVVVVKHPDGMYSGYAHLSAALVSPGQGVAKGQHIAATGNSGTCTTGPHLHLTMSPEENGYMYGTTVDPYAYIKAHEACSCDRDAGGFTFSCDGAQANMACVNVDEPGDPHTWNDNFFCSKLDLGMKWSYAGPIADMECTAVFEASEPNAAAWSDNYLCVPPQSPFALSYSSAGPIAGKSCVHWNETSDLANSWDDNYVCADPVHVFSAAGFTFSAVGPVDGKHCVTVDEPGDPDTWSDNHFCSDEDVGMQWSFAGPIDGMECTNVPESADDQASVWTDNYLCLPADADYVFTWSSAGPIDGQSCVRWFEHSESSTWIDNWMCVEKLAPPTGTGGTGSGGGTSSGSGGNGWSPGASNTAGSQQTDVSAADDAGGCAVRSRGATSWCWEALGLLAALALRRRRPRAQRSLPL